MLDDEAEVDPAAEVEARLEMAELGNAIDAGVDVAVRGVDEAVTVGVVVFTLLPKNCCANDLLAARASTSASSFAAAAMAVMECCIGSADDFAFSAACISVMSLVAVRPVPMTPQRHCSGCAIIERRWRCGNQPLSERASDVRLEGSGPADGGCKNVDAAPWTEGEVDRGWDRESDTGVEQQ